MCAVSQVFDRFTHPFDRWTQPQPSTQIQWPLPSPEMAELRALIKEFREALAAAKAKDIVEGAADCEDPDKAKLLARVAELERLLTEATKRRIPPRKAAPRKGGRW